MPKCCLTERGRGKQRGRGRREALPGYDITRKMSWPNLLCRSQNTTFPPPERKRSSTAQSNQVRERVNPTTFPSESRPPCHADRPPIPPSDDDIVNRFVQRGDDDDDIQTQTSTLSPAGFRHRLTLYSIPPKYAGLSSGPPQQFGSSSLGCCLSRPQRSRLSNLEPRVPPSVSVIVAGPRGRDLFCRPCPLVPL